jgi:hypothetical protein
VGEEKSEKGRNKKSRAERILGVSLLFVMLFIGLGLLAMAAGPDPSPVTLPEETLLLKRISGKVEVMEEVEPGVFQVIDDYPPAFYNLVSVAKKDSGEFEIILTTERTIPIIFAFCCFVGVAWVCKDLRKE